MDEVRQTRQQMILIMCHSYNKDVLTDLKRNSNSEL